MSRCIFNDVIKKMPFDWLFNFLCIYYYFHYLFGENSEVDFLSTSVTNKNDLCVSSPDYRIWTGNHLNTNNLFLA